MKKVFGILLLCGLVLSNLSGCGGDTSKPSGGGGGGGGGDKGKTGEKK